MNNVIKVIAAGIACFQQTQQIIKSIAVDSCPPNLFCDSEEEEEKLYPLLKRNRQEDVFQQTMAYQCQYHQSPSLPLHKETPLDKVFRDPNRNYSKICMGLYGWEFFALHDHVRASISQPRKRDATKRRRAKHNTQHRLYFALNWLHDATTFRRGEMDMGWAKSSCNDDLPHVLKAISHNLDDFIAWPDAEKRAQLASEHTGVFAGNIAILDITETEIDKPDDPELERATWSGKMKCNTLKTLAVVLRSGEVIFLLTGIPGGAK